MAIAFVQETQNTNSGAVTTITLTLGSPTTAGNCLVVAWTAIGLTTQPSAVSATLGGSAGNFASAVAASNFGAGILTDRNCAGGQTSIVLTFTGGAGNMAIGAYAYEFSGVDTTSPVDKTSSALTGTTTWTSAATATTAQAAEVWVGLGSVYNTVTATVAGPATLWTNETIMHPSSGANFLNAVSGYQIVSATGAATYSGTGGISGQNTGVVATLKAASGTPGNVNLTTPNLALAAPLAGPGGGVGLTTPNLALAAPVVAPSAGGTPVNVNLTTPNLSLAAPTPTVKAGASVALTTPTLSLSAPLVTPPIAPGTFPDSPLGVRVEINAGGWQDISSYVAIDSGAAVTITYGRADASQQTNPTTAAMKWNNTDARFSPRNPLGPYYPALGRNTPVRVSIPSEDNYLRFADDNTSFASTPDSVGLSITGDMELQFDLDLQNYTPTMLLSKSGGGSNNSWTLALETNGKLRFEWSASGSDAFAELTSIPIPVGRMAWKITFQASTGTVTFYTAPTIAGPWTQFGDVGGFGSSFTIHDSTAPVVIGGVTSWVPECAAIVGRVYAVKILSGIGGTVKASPDFTAASPGASTVTDAQGNVWTLNGTAEISSRDYLFHGEAAALPQQWDRDDIWTPVSAAGVLRRIGQSSATLDSPMKRGYMHLSPVPVAYWPGEDGTASTQIAAAIGGQAMTFNGTPNLSSNSDFLCSQAIPVLNGSIWTAFVPQYSGGTDIVMRFLMEVPAAGETDGDLIAMVHSSGTVRTFQLKYKSGGSLEITGFASDGSQLFDQTSAFAVNGELLRVSLELRQIGGNIQYSVATLLVGAANGAGISGTISGTLGHATQIHINPGGGLNATAVGHVSVQSVWESLFDLAPELNAFQGEAAGDRFARLCAEESLNCRIYGPSSLTRIMGAQSVDTLINLLQECEDADNGMIIEPMDTLGLGYRTSRSMVAQSAAVALDYAADHVSPPLSPTDDDLYTANDITASRPNGSSARAFLNDGSPMSVSQPQDGGVGPYVTFATVNVNADSMLTDNANWLLHIGTVNEERYPQMKVDLAATSPAIVALFRPVLGTRVGDVVTVDNVPSFLPPDGISVIVWGNTLVIGDFVCNVVWQTQPASPYNVFVASTGRANTNGSTLHANATSGATSITVDTQTGSALWTTNSGDWPFDILVGGERMTVTHISGTSGTQTFTVTRAVNGIVKAHTAGDSVNLFSPCYYALS